jgi:hypothetical protein
MLHAQVADFFLPKIAVFLCRSEERSVRGLILDWRKCVDIRLSLALKFGLLKQKFVRDTRMLHQALQQVSLDALARRHLIARALPFIAHFQNPVLLQLVYNKTYRHRMLHLQKQVMQRVAVRRLTLATRFVTAVALSSSSSLSLLLLSSSSSSSSLELYQ